MEKPGKAGEAAAANAFLQQYMSDQAESRERSLEEYQALFPGYEKTVAEQWARILREISSGGLTEVAIPDELQLEEPGRWQELLDRIRHRNLDETRFEDRGEVARGGMGVVESLFDSDLRRTVAMKICLATDGKAPTDPGGSDPKSLGRFLEEAQVTAQLEHPGVVPVHDLGVDTSGKPFFTMRLVRGKDLRQVFKQVSKGEEEWTQTRALGVLMKACEAMAYAHDKGVVHRDLKPPNIMVGKFGEVYVMDWGLARVRGREETRDLRLQPESPPTQSMETLRRDEREGTPDSPLVTMDGDVMGTPSYMSPEQAWGEVEKIGPRSDVYAMGVILYELLSNRLPYELPGAPRSPRTILSLLQEGPPAPLSEVASEAPVQLMAICEKAMSRDADDRYADMIEFADDLRAYLEGRVVQAYETGALAEMKSWVRRNRALSTTIAASILIAVLGSMGYAWKIEKEKNRAVEERDRAEAVKEFVVTMLSSVNPVKAGSMDKELMKMVLSDAAANVGEKFAEYPLLEAEIRTVIGESYRGLGLYDGAEGHLKRAWELRRQEWGAENTETLFSLHNLGNALFSQGKFVQAEVIFREVLEARRRILGDAHRETLASVGNLGVALVGQNRLADAEPLMREALGGFRLLVGNEDPETLGAITNLGAVLEKQLKYKEAEPYYRESLEISRRVHGEEYPGTLRSIHNIGTFFAHQKKYREAEEYYRQALDLRRRVQGNDHPETLGSIIGLGVALYDQQKYADAVPYLHEAFEGLRGKSRREASLVQMALRLFRCYERMGQPEEAERYRPYLVSPEDQKQP